MHWIFYIGWILAILVIWLETDAMLEYAEIFKLKFFKYEDYRATKKGPLAMMSGQTYAEYLLFRYGNHFWVRLATCPLCLTVWLNLIGSVICRMPVASFGASTFLIWVLYYLLHRMIRKSLG